MQSNSLLYLFKVNLRLLEFQSIRDFSTFAQLIMALIFEGVIDNKRVISLEGTFLGTCTYTVMLNGENTTSNYMRFKMNRDYLSNLLERRLYDQENVSGCHELKDFIRLS
jgi:hypothetical protein